MKTLSKHNQNTTLKIILLNSIKSIVLICQNLKVMKSLYQPANCSKIDYTFSEEWMYEDRSPTGTSKRVLL